MAEADSFDVVILGFDARDEAPQARLEKAFGVDGETAERILVQLPATVQRAVSRVRAEYFRRALVRIGAAVEVRDPSSGEVMQMVPSPSFPPPGNMRAEAPPAVEAGPGWGPPPPSPAAWTAPAGAPPLPALDDYPSGNTMPEIPNQGALQQAALAPGWGGGAAARAEAGGTFPVLNPASPPAFPALEWPAADGPSALTSPRPPEGVSPSWNWSFSASSGVGPPTGSAAVAESPNLNQGRAGAAAFGAPGVAPAWDAATGFAGPAGPVQAGADFPLPLLDPAAVEAVAMPRERSDVWDPPPAKPRAEPAPAPAPRHAAAAMARPRARPADDSMPRPPTMSDGPAPFALPQRAPNRVREVNPRPATVGMSERPPPAAAAQRTVRAGGTVPAGGTVRAGGTVPAGGTAPAYGSTPAGETFWESIGEACVLPLRGPGLYWVFSIGALSVAVAVLAMLAGFMAFVGLGVMFFANTCVLAFACDYYRVCMWAPPSGEQVIDRSPDFDPVRLLNNYIKSGIHLSLFMLASQLLVIAHVAYMIAAHGFNADTVVELATHPLTWLLVLFPLYYWTMGVGLTALHHNFMAIWNVPAGVRAIARAPLEYTAIVAIGMLVFGVSCGALLLFGAWMGMTGSLLAGATGVPLALSHGIQGALMGHLLRTRPDVFEA